MTIGTVNGAYQAQPGQIGKGAEEDPVAKGIRDKITRAQKELKELSANAEMNMEQKQKKRQELQREISDLTMQLHQHQMEQKQKERQEKMQSMDELMGTASSVNGDGRAGRTAGSENGAGFSTVAAEALISADGARKAAQMQGSVASRMEGRAGTLEAEIKLDAARGGNTERKETEIASLRQKARNAQNAQIDILREANDKLEASAQEEGTSEEISREEAEQEEIRQDGDAGEEDGLANTNAANTSLENAIEQPIDQTWTE